MPIATLSRLRPISDLNTALKLFFQSRLRDHFPRLRFPFVPGRPMGFLGKLIPGSSSPYLKNLWEALSSEIGVYRLPSNHSRPKETDPKYDFPTSSYVWLHVKLSQFVSRPGMFSWPGYKHTNKQTNLFYFVRPSFQSTELIFWE